MTSERYVSTIVADRLLPELAQLLLSTPTVDDFLTELAGAAAVLVQPAASCGITLQRERRPITVSSSDATAALLDEVQYAIDRGPCLQALSTGDVVTVTDTSTEKRWGTYPAHALRQGVRSSLSVPLAASERTLGAMNLYSTEVGAFGPEDVEAASALAAQAESVLRVVIQYAEQAQLTVQLREALTTRAVIDHAIGITMAARQCNATEAFAVLRTQSQNQNRKLRDLTAELVREVSGEEPADEPTFNAPRASG